MRSETHDKKHDTCFWYLLHVAIIVAKPTVNRGSFFLAKYQI